MRAITDRQLEFLAFLDEFRKTHGKPPTFKEIALGMGISSKGTVSAMMKNLERHGQIDRIHGAYRGVRVSRSVQSSR